MEKKIFKVSEPIISIGMDINSENEESKTSVMKFNHKTDEWEKISGDDNSNVVSYKIPIFQSPKQAMKRINEYIEARNKNAELLNSFANVILGIPYKPKS